MPGGYGTDESLPWGSSGDSYTYNIGPSAGIAALPERLHHDPNKEYRSFQVRANEPDARALEKYAFDSEQERGYYPMNIDIGLHPNWKERKNKYLNTAVHPFEVLNVSNKRKIDPVTNTDALGDYKNYLLNRLNQNWINQENLRIKNENTFQAGITNSNLGGAKVWNAGGPFASGPFEGDYPFPGMQWLEHKLIGDPDDKQGPPLDNEGNLLPGWELHQDGWHYFPPYEGDGEDTPIRDKFFEEMDTPYTLEADLKLQDVIDLYESKGLDLNTDRFMRRAKNAGVEVTGMDDSLQYLDRQMDELDPDSPNYEDMLELLQSDKEMKYPWAVLS